MNKNNDIVLFPNQILRSENEKIDRVSQEVLELAEKLEDNLMTEANGAGLSAPQVGVNKQMFAIAHGKHVHIFVNPEIISHEEKEKTYPQMIDQEGKREDFFEGCLSFPGLFGTVKRWLEIEVSYQVINENKELEKKEETLTGFEAIVFQHEVDHLNGVLFVDRIKQNKGELFEQKDDQLEEIDVKEILNKESKS